MSLARVARLAILIACIVMPSLHGTAAHALEGPGGAIVIAAGQAGGAAPSTPADCPTCQATAQQQHQHAASVHAVRPATLYVTAVPPLAIPALRRSVRTAPDSPRAPPIR